ncbi:MAG: hypothetical protein ACXWV4_07235 [Flavitalea sp.]
MKGTKIKILVLAVLVFQVGYWLGPYFFSWFLLGSVPLFSGVDMFDQLPRLRASFGIVMALFAVLVCLNWQKPHLTIPRKMGIMILFSAFIVSGALVSKLFMPSYFTEFSASSGSGMKVDSQLLAVALERVILGISLGLMLAFALLNILFRRMKVKASSQQ